MNFTTLVTEEVVMISNPIMDNLMEASTENDQQLHTRDFTARKNALALPHTISRNDLLRGSSC